MRGDDLASFPIDTTTPDDVRILHDNLCLFDDTASHTLNIDNCGTAMRFLTAFYAQKTGCDIVLDGCERMHERPIGQLVDALRELGADISYLGSEGYPPLHIRGRQLTSRTVTLNNPQSTQFVSALMLIGVKVHTDCQSPYIAMTQSLIDQTGNEATNERCWSSAAFWYEYVAIYGGELFLCGLSKESLQGDKTVADIFSNLGVNTVYEKEGVRIRKVKTTTTHQPLTVNFSSCPDLYSAVFATCVRIGVKMCFSGLESLPLKESNRLEAMKQLLKYHTVSSYGDHRVAMAAIVAGYEVDDTACISKSYPLFLKQWQQLRP